MFLFIAVLAFLSAAFLLFRFATRRPTLTYEKINVPIDPPPNARPLFAPTDADLRRDAGEDKARSIARREYRAKAEARSVVDSALTAWRINHDARAASELLRVSAASGLEGDLARAGCEILEFYRANGIVGLPASNLADLLDSHLRLLSNSERGSGEVFWLKQEVARLRTETEIVSRDTRSRDLTSK